MSIPVQPGRVDLLLLALAEAACKRHLDPALKVPGAWDAGLNRVAANAIQRAGIPSRPVTSVRIGQLNLPIETVQFLARLCGFDRRLPSAE